MINIVLFGKPGAGKGTQAEFLKEKYNLTHLSTGDIFRYNIKNETDLGKLAKSYMDKGDLVPDEVTIKMLQDTVEKNPDTKGFLFDGFPRTAAQAEALDKLLELKKAPIDVMLALEVSEEELVKRLMKRGETSGRSDDTNEEIIRARILEYHNKTTAVADYYNQFNKVSMVEGEGSIDDIFGSLCAAIDARIEA